MSGSGSRGGDALIPASRPQEVVLSEVRIDDQLHTCILPSADGVAMPALHWPLASVAHLQL